MVQTQTSVLPWSYCRLLSNENDRRRRRKRSTATVSCTGPIVLRMSSTHSRSDEEEEIVYICRIQDTFSIHDDNENVPLCYDDSVQIIPSSSTLMTEGKTRQSKNSKILSPVSILHDLIPFLQKKCWSLLDHDGKDSTNITQALPCTSKNSHRHVVVIAGESKTIADIVTASDGGVEQQPFHPTFLAPIYGQPTPLLSILLTYDFSSIDQKTFDPLLLSSLKRSLVGVTIAHSRTVTTVLWLPLPQIDQKEKKQQQSRKKQRLAFRVTNVATQNRPNQPPFFHIILPSTRITIVPEKGDNNATKSTLETYTTNENIGTENPIQALSPTATLLVNSIRCIRLQSSAIPRAFLLSGPPGVGKTHAVRLAVTQSENEGPIKLLSLRGSELLAKGSSIDASRSLKRQFEEAAALTAGKTNQMADNDKMKCVVLIFLDECDALLTDDFVAAMLATLLDRFDGSDSINDTGWSRLLLVAATNRVDSIPPHLRRAGRLDREIPIGPPNVFERMNILEWLLRDYTTTTKGNTRSESLLTSVVSSKGVLVESAKKETIDQDQLRSIAELCVGYVSADLVSLVRRATLLAIQDGVMADRITMEHMTKALSDVGASALRDASLSAPPRISWEDIAGDPGGAKTALRQAIEWPRTKRKAFESLGLVPPRGILLHGPPGCAKTTLARAAAGASGVAFLCLSPAEVYASSYVGEAESVVRRTFTLARSVAPCILFFDEIDSIFGSSSNGCGNGNNHGMNRSGQGNSAEARVLSTFLNEMDGIDGTEEDGVLVLGATNRPWTLDSALLRPGRLGDKIIYVPPPDYPARRSIFETQCRHWKTDEALDLDFLASEAVTGKMTGAEIVGACREAAMRALCETELEKNTDGMVPVPMIKKKYLEQSLQSFKPVLSNPEVLEEFQIFRQNR